MTVLLVLCKMAQQVISVNRHSAPRLPLHHALNPDPCSNGLSHLLDKTQILSLALQNLLGGARASTAAPLPSPPTMHALIAGFLMLYFAHDCPFPVVRDKHEAQRSSPPLDSSKSGEGHGLIISPTCRSQDTHKTDVSEGEHTGVDGGQGRACPCLTASALPALSHGSPCLLFLSLSPYSSFIYATSVFHQCFFPAWDILGLNKCALTD